ncbi:MAG: hypothetical protein U0822_15775 [Anaerolineae bacterium]
MEPPSDHRHEPSRRLVPGLILVGLGIIFLIAQFVPLGNWILLILGLVFLVAYFVSRLPGLLWPGSILTGLGAGLLASQLIGVQDTLTGALVLAGLSLGFFAVYIIDALITPPAPVGALWAGGGTGIAAVIVWFVALGIVPPNIWDALGRLWPLILIVIGILILMGVIGGRRHRDR